MREKEKMKRKSNTVSDQAKVEKRRKRNREAAKKCREKKNAQIAQLEAEKERVIFCEILINARNGKTEYCMFKCMFVINCMLRNSCKSFLVVHTKS